MLVNRGSRYSVIASVLGSRRITRSLYSPPAQTSPYLSAVTSYGHDSRVGATHSRNVAVRVSNIPIRSARFSPNHKRACASIMPRRGAEPFVGVCHTLIAPVFASILPMCSRPKTVK